ncbi:cbb3-type cytochrome c oxidase subunit II [Rhodocytophaga aerolata]|uniref:Cbb3-type cytochrome c oxidase subunit II n=1 Tax=Rhodocytophaga aerolata TaxID=455078 RepID=A0ABT8RFH4_9BACT|nr:cbb3-type cytochrome c oxidase subunit II [Rhodocytophaga aerolata]MDO1450854.1 cbb3-type cytochrome c oxidase subunit II [Rhodocytophaga aerolata]
MDFFNNHKYLFGAALLLFLGLTLAVAILPAISNQNNNAPLPQAVALSDEAAKGKMIYIAEGCVACHTQQVRNVDMDKLWGSRPSISADYADIKRTDFWRNTATLMGTERTGPDLINIGNRQPSSDWHLLHLYNPRAVVSQSIMPAYPWLFVEKQNPGKEDIVIHVPDEFRKKSSGSLVASQEALHLVAYLQSLKQTPLPDGTPQPSFLYKAEKPDVKEMVGNPEEVALPDGQALYSSNCQACHQPNGEGLKGAFPALKESKIVLDENPELFVKIIMQGYDANPAFGVMPAVGINNQLLPEAVAAIMNHERTSWGNSARKVTAAEVKKIMELIGKEVPQ